MFLPWTLFLVNLILLTTRFLAVAAIGAILAIYSRLRGEHANSIRWIRQGGYLEMFRFLINTRKEITIQAKAALLFAIIATLVADISGRGAVHFIEPTTRQSNPSFLNVTTKQYMPSIDDTFIGGWSGTIYRGANITNVMVSMINDTKITKVIPDAIDGRIYTPRTFDYEIGCSNIDISVMSGTGNFALGDAGCARIKLIILGDFNFIEDGMNVTKRSSDRWSISMPVEYVNSSYVSELSLYTGTIYNNSTCALVNYNNGLLDTPKDGSTSLPITVATKCVYPSGDVVAMSQSISRFMTITSSQFTNVSKIIFDEYGELFQAMETSLDTITESNSTFFVEVKSENGTTNSLSCLKAPNPSINNTSFLSCMYLAAQSTILKSEALEPVIASAQRDSQNSPDTTAIMSFTHLASIDKGFSAQISIAELRNHTLDAAHYLASLGHNLYVNWNRQEVTIMFEITDAEEGLEIPNWLIIFVPIIAVISSLLVGSTEYFLDARYTSSLYKSIALSMRSRMNSFAPMLMRSKVDPIEFEGIPVVPSGPQFEADPKNVAILKSENNSCTTLVDDKLFSDKLSFGNKTRF